jgi:uncharacterized protein YqeY
VPDRQPPDRGRRRQNAGLAFRGGQVLFHDWLIYHEIGAEQYVFFEYYFFAEPGGSRRGRAVAAAAQSCYLAGGGPDAGGPAPAAVPKGGLAMTVVQRMRAKLGESMKARDAAQTQFLRYWIAQLTLGDGTEAPDAEAFKKMRGVLKEAKSGQTTFTPQELAFIQQWVPPSLSREQVAEALAPVAAQIKAAPKEGMAMGLAMKALGGQVVESDDVKAVVAGLRQ